MSTEYLDLPYNQVAFKASHNSYQRDEPFIEQINFDPKAPYQAGCRALELDIAQSDSGLAWSVGHKGSYDKDYRQLSQFLSELRAYGQRNPAHDPIALYLDLKHVATGTWPDQLDQYILDHLGDSSSAPLYSPGALMKGYNTLPEGARGNGWPSVGELRGRYLIILTGDKDAKAKYAVTEPAKRLCFADKDQDQGEDPSSADRVFFNYHLYSSGFDKWCPVFKKAALRRDAIIRGYELDGETLWNNALACGCHALATNKIRGSKWAKVSDDAPFVKLPPLG